MACFCPGTEEWEVVESLINNYKYISEEKKEKIKKTLRDLCKEVRVINEVLIKQFDKYSAEEGIIKHRVQDDIFIHLLIEFKIYTQNYIPPKNIIFGLRIDKEGKPYLSLRSLEEGPGSFYFEEIEVKNSYKEVIQHLIKNYNNKYLALSTRVD